MIARPRQVILAVQFLIALILPLVLLGKNQGVPYYLFWPVVLLLVAVSALGYNLPSKHRLAMIIMLEFALTSIGIAAMPEIYQLGRDEIFESQYTQEVIDAGEWDPSLGKGFAENYYGHNPVLHMVMAFLSLTTGLSPYFLSKYAYVFVLRVFFAVSAYVLIGWLLRDKPHIAYISTLVYLGTARLFLMGISRRVMGAAFLLLSLYALSRSMHANKVAWTGMFLIFSTLVVLSDHTVSYILMAFLLVLFLAYLIKSARPLRRIGSRLWLPNTSLEVLYYMGIWFLWNILISSVLIVEEFKYGWRIVGTILNSEILAGEIVPIDPSVHINHLYENAVIAFSQVLFLLLAAAGLFALLQALRKGRPERGAGFLAVFSAFGFAGFCLAGILFVTSWGIIPQVTLWIFALPLSVLAGSGIELVSGALKVRTNTMLSIVLICLMFAGGLLLTVNPTAINRNPNEDLVLEFVTARTQELYESGRWLRENTERSGAVLGDTTVFDIYSGYFGFDVVTEGFARDLYAINSTAAVPAYIDGDFEFAYITFNKKKHHIDYVVINDAVFEYPSFLLGKPVGQEFRRIMDESMVNKIYDNGKIQIYENI